MSEPSPKETTVQPLVEGQVVSGTLFSESMRVETIREGGPDTSIAPLRKEDDLSVLRLFQSFTS
jgi:hypothetical protein